MANEAPEDVQQTDTIDQEQHQMRADEGQEMGQQPEGEGNTGEDVAYNELLKSDILDQYRGKCEEAGIEPHEAFVAYLEETMEENDGIDLVIPGNDKYNFTNRIDDDNLAVLCATLKPVAIYMVDMDLRFNKITDVGAKALADLVSKAPRLLGLNLQGNSIKSEGAQYLAEALKECTNLQMLNLNGNKIKTNGAMMVTELLFTHDKLLSLNLGNNKIDHDGIIGILSVLNSSNYTLEELNIENPVYKTIC